MFEKLAQVASSMNRPIGSTTASIVDLRSIERLGRQIMAETPETNKPDFRNGFPIHDLGDGSMISGQADGEELVLVRRGDEVFAFGAHCTHYGGPLAEGLIVDDTVRCPWHHACFSLRTGEALRAPALNPVPCYAVVERDGRVFVSGKLAAPGSVRRRVPRGTPLPRSVAI